MNKKNGVLGFVALLLFHQLIFAQSIGNILSSNQANNTSLIRFDNKTTVFSEQQAIAYLKSLSGSYKRTSFENMEPATMDQYGIYHKKYQQQYKNIPVENGVIILHSKNSIVNSVTCNLKKNININIYPSISKAEALTFALDYVGSSEYMWEDQAEEQLLKKIKKDLSASYFPEGKLCIYDKKNKYNLSKYYLSYKFDIYSKNPTQRQVIYVNAMDGSIIYCYDKFTDASAVGETRYSGTKTFETLHSLEGYLLRDNTRGNGIITKNLNFLGEEFGAYCTNIPYASAVDYVDDDNNWSAQEYDNFLKDNAAIEAHWATQVTYDYFNENFNRNSFDNQSAPIWVYLNPCENYENAFWDGIRITIGGGYLIHDNFACVDVIAHELGHAITGAEIGDHDVIYEPGAVEEGISDIWASCVEHYVNPNRNIWQIMDQISLNSYCERDLQNPKQKGMPDTYMGQYWINELSNDNGGIHTNCTVLGHWFYLLSEGGTGVNDNGDFYHVEGIGIEEASKIIYSTVTNYMTPNTGFEAFKQFTMQVANNMYCEYCVAYTSILNAWHAVGLGEPVSYYESYLMVDQNLSNIENIFAASNIVEANSHIYNGSGIDFVSGKNIIFSPGFHAEDCFLKASICACGEIDNTGYKSIQESYSETEDIQNVSPLKEKDVAIFPNPSRGTFSIQTPIEQYSVKIINSRGQEIYSNNDNNQNITIELNTEPGIYFIKITNANSQYIKKLIISK
ncbi:MAG: hypothetical protein C0594_07590 [Marinilabiliales bacterium]|nr:MAG: hypothetical protein C0594_07590 [Marinilabiliales bacterium]